MFAVNENRCIQLPILPKKKEEMGSHVVFTDLNSVASSFKAWHNIHLQLKKTYIYADSIGKFSSLSQ